MNTAHGSLKKELGPSIELYKACLELQKSEILFHQSLSSVIDNILINRKIFQRKYKNILEPCRIAYRNHLEEHRKNNYHQKEHHDIFAKIAFENYLINNRNYSIVRDLLDTIRSEPKIQELLPYTSLIKENPFTESNIMKEFLENKIEKVLDHLCIDIINQITSPDFLKTLLLKNRLNKLLKEDLGAKDPGELSSLPLKETLQHSKQIERIIKEAEKLKTISDPTIKKLHVTLEIIQKAISDIEIIEKTKLPDEDRKNIIILLSHNIHLPQDITSSKKTNQMLKKVSHSIKTETPKQILETLKKHGFEQDLKLAHAEEMKQDSYYNKVDVAIREKLRSTGAKLNAKQSRRMGIIAKILGFKDDTNYLIYKLNDAYVRGDFKEIRSHLHDLGLDEKQLEKAITNIKETLLPYAKARRVIKSHKEGKAKKSINEILSHLRSSRIHPPIPKHIHITSKKGLSIGELTAHAGIAKIEHLKHEKKSKKEKE